MTKKIKDLNRLDADALGENYATQAQHAAFSRWTSSLKNVLRANVTGATLEFNTYEGVFVVEATCYLPTDFDIPKTGIVSGTVRVDFNPNVELPSLTLGRLLADIERLKARLMFLGRAEYEAGLPL